jgi:ribosomal protein S18 acetylase RimI-like enzyme
VLRIVDERLVFPHSARLAFVSGMGGISVEEAGTERLDEIESLWLALKEHHLSVDEPDLADIRRARQTWEGRRRGFEEVLRRKDSFMLIARSERRTVGYAVADIRERGDNWRISGARYADLESIAVVPDARGQGVGTALMGEIAARLERLGINEMTTQVVMGNDAARRFYERLGFKPWTVNYLGDLSRRER